RSIADTGTVHRVYHRREWNFASHFFAVFCFLSSAAVTGALRRRCSHAATIDGYCRPVVTLYLVSPHRLRCWCAAHLTRFGTSADASNGAIGRHLRARTE